MSGFVFTVHSNSVCVSVSASITRYYVKTNESYRDIAKVTISP